MKASEVRLLNFLKRSPQFIIPIYQRTYSWAEPECRQLWNDILRAGKSEGISAHFVGSIVYIQEGLFHVTDQSPLLVIDGQQRLATVMLIIEALAQHLGDSEPIDGFSAKKLRNYYLLNDLESDEKRYKLLLTQTDKETMLAIMGQRKQLPGEYSLRLNENFEFFKKQIEKLGTDLESLCKGLFKLVLVDISLSRGEDNPQLIFESMNSTGRELSQADLIRNFVLMGLEPTHQTSLYKEHWRPMEVAFGQEAYGQQFDSFMRHYLTIKTNEIPKVRGVYDAFKAHARSQQVTANGIDALVEEIHNFAGYYCAIALNKESHPRLKVAFADLRELKVDVPYPLLLELYQDYILKKLSADELELAVRLVESYVFRRVICSIPANSMDKTFATFGRSLNKERYMESIQAHFLLMQSYRQFPDDGEFRLKILVRDLYKIRSRSYWLRRMENHDRRELVSLDEYTIEHIMPQNENISKEWQAELGPEYERVHNQYLHTLGNLTLTAYNPEYSDRPFSEKRDMDGVGLRDSPLRLNKGLGKVETWNETAIRQRASRLANEAVTIWAAPNLPKSILDNYSSAISKQKSGHTIGTMDGAQFLVVGSPTRTLFDAVRKAVHALDPCVTEEFLKHYVAYKAETNFVDIVPKAKGLRLYLNLDFHELYDPREMARDVSNIGSWGNGDVEIRLEKSDDLPYVMGMIRQSFDKQMGDS